MDDQRTDAWINAEMAGDEAARFEREAGLDRAREWLDAPPPGLARADRLEIPRLNPRSSVPSPRRWRWLWQPAMAAALFIGGFLMGRTGQSGSAGPLNAVPANASVKVTPLPTPAVRHEAVQLARASEPRYVTDQDGRVIIETPNATWVIDSKFKLAAGGN